jgi:hypothetical protein
VGFMVAVELGALMVADITVVFTVVGTVIDNL